MAEVFDTPEGRAFYGRCLRLGMDSFRNQALISGAITFRQKTALTALVGRGPEVHNSKLLDIVAEREKYRALAETVKALGHFDSYTQFMTLLEGGVTGKVVGATGEVDPATAERAIAEGIAKLKRVRIVIQDDTSAERDPSPASTATREKPVEKLTGGSDNPCSALKSRRQSPSSEPRAKRRFSTQLGDTDATDGQEDYNLAPSDVLDRRLDGYLPDYVHLAQESILPMKLYCTNEACKKYLYKNKDTSLGSCFLIQQLNEVKECGYLYFATAAHNLYCKFCEKYRWVKPILRWTAGQREADDFLLGAGNRGVSERNFYGWMKVSDGYIRGISERRDSKECYPFDYGILAVKIARIPQATQYAWKVRGMGMFAAPPDRLDFVERAYLCGYPGEVCNKNRNVPPQGPPANPADLQYLDPKPVGDGYYKWQVKGGRFWMPPDQSLPGQKATGTEKPSERYRKERRTAALYPLPQMHQRMICGKQDTDFNKARLYRHYIDSSAGQSGSPVYLFREKDDYGNQQCVAVGIHVGLWEDVKGEVKRMGFNVAVRLHGDVLSELKRWVSDPSNKATDSLNTDVDVLEDTEDFEIVCQPPTFFGSNKAVPVAAAQARQHGASAVKESSPASTENAGFETASQQDTGAHGGSWEDVRHQVHACQSLPEERQGNPWRHPQFIETTYSLKRKLTEFGEARALCYSLGLIGTESYDQLQLLKSKFEHNEKLLSYLKTGDADSFAKFREVMRHLNQEVNVFAKILEKWDTIGPFKEDYQHIEKQLNDAG